MNEAIIEKMNRIAEDIFGTRTDPEQIPITRESRDRLDALSPAWLVYELDAQGEPISWVVAVPTQKNVAMKFVKKEISERELLKETVPAKKYDALYLSSAITVPAHRRQGLARKLIRRAIAENPLAPDALIVGWPTTPEGTRFSEALSREAGQTVILRK